MLNIEPVRDHMRNEEEEEFIPVEEKLMEEEEEFIPCKRRLPQSCDSV